MIATLQVGRGARLRITIVVFAAATLLARFSVAAALEAPLGTFKESGGPRQLAHQSSIYEWKYTAAVGETEFDKIGLHRIANGPRPKRKPALVLLYLPGTNMNGEIAVEDPHVSLPVYLATHGVDVWTLDYRTHFVPPNAQATDLAHVMQRWTNEEFAGDIETATKFIVRETGAKKIFVAGFSRGVEFAYLFAALHPAQVKGIIALDGFIPQHPSQAAPPDRLVDDIGGAHLTYEKRRFLMQAVIDNPDGPAPIPKYKTAKENLEHVVYDAKEFGGKGGLANALGGMSDPVVLAHVLITYDRYWPGVQDFENPFTPALIDTLNKANIPVIAFSSTNISTDWPSMVLDSAQSASGGAVEFYKLKNLGHLDVLCGTASEYKVYKPVLDFLTQHQAG